MDVRSQFRIPEAIYTWLKGEAVKEHRSINGQLVAELSARVADKSKSDDTQPESRP